MNFNRLTRLAPIGAVFAASPFAAEAAIVTVQGPGNTNLFTIGVDEDIDVDGDGNDDLSITSSVATEGDFPVSAGSTQTIINTISGLGSGLVTSGGPLAGDTLIDGTSSFVTSNQIANTVTTKTADFDPSSSSVESNGTWGNAFSGFIGFSFQNQDGDTFFGWGEVVGLPGETFQPNFDTLVYEDVAGVGIQAGSFESLAPAQIPLPAPMLLLVSGIAGIGALRGMRKKSDA